MPGVAHWLATRPTRKEFERVIGQMQQDKVFEVLLACWDSAQTANEGDTAAWKVGLVVPLWKRKGDIKDGTWRAVTLLSVGAEAMARLAINRLARWSNTWLHESQTGFRTGRRVDDVQQVRAGLQKKWPGCWSDCLISKMLILEYVVRRCGGSLNWGAALQA